MTQTILRVEVEHAIRTKLQELTARLLPPRDRDEVITALVDAINQLVDVRVSERTACAGDCGRTLFLASWTCNHCLGDDHAQARMEVGQPLGLGQSAIERINALIYRELTDGDANDSAAGTPSDPASRRQS